jgi:hypothetical protein
LGVSGEVAPIMDVSKFIYCWAIYQTVVTVYVALFVSESGVHDIQQEEEEEIDLTFKQTIAVFKDVLMNRHIWIWWLFKAICNSVAIIGASVGQVYLTNDLGFDKENLAFVKLITAPAGIIVSMLSGYIISKEPIKTYYYAMFFSMVFDTYHILFMLRTFPEKDQVTNWTIAHVACVNTIHSIQGNFTYVSLFAFIMRVTDKRISGIHVTMLASLSNFAYHIHKFYIFSFIERFGIFAP